jgi:hypothetical protein
MSKVRMSQVASSIPFDNTTGIPTNPNNLQDAVADSFDLLSGGFIQSYSNRSTTSTSTTSTTNITLLSITNPVAGTYNLVTTGIFTHSTNNGQAVISISVGGVQVANTQVTMVRSVNLQMTYSISLPIIVNGSQNVDIVWRTNAGTLTNILRSMSLIKIGE